ncbi:MAG TPA: hypothetical protein VE972_15060 [Conexibacter sp.]|nr:hypothetical protein [Conexibacter sp.]
MTGDEPASVRLVDALIGRSQAKLAGRIDTLAEAQRLAVEISSREHQRVRESIEQVDRKLAALDEKVDQLAGRGAADAAVAMWRRRFVAALVSGVTLVTPLAIAVLQRLLAS